MRNNSLKFEPVQFSQEARCHADHGVPGVTAGGECVRGTVVNNINPGLLDAGGNRKALNSVKEVRVLIFTARTNSALPKPVSCPSTQPRKAMKTIKMALSSSEFLLLLAICSYI